jgi:alkylhydroperoxidase family enzyme
MDVQRQGRAPWITAGAMTPEQRAFVDRVRSGWSGGAVGVEPIDAEGRLRGPFDLMAASPAVGGAVLATAGAYRDASLSLAEREVVIVMVAAARDAPFMWAGHAPLLHQAGVDPAPFAGPGSGSHPDLTPTLARVRDVTAALLLEGDLDDALFAAAEDELGWVKVQEIVWLVGLYEAFALAMRVARTPDPRR